MTLILSKQKICQIVLSLTKKIHWQSFAHTYICTFWSGKSNLTQNRKKPIEFEQINQKKTTNVHTIINNVNHFTNYLNSGKTWKNIKDMYILILPQC